jgi:hypothetical protein
VPKARSHRRGSRGSPSQLRAGHIRLRSRTPARLVVTPGPQDWGQVEVDCAGDTFGAPGLPRSRSRIRHTPPPGTNAALSSLSTEHFRRGTPAWN